MTCRSPFSSKTPREHWILAPLEPPRADRLTAWTMSPVWGLKAPQICYFLPPLPHGLAVRRAHRKMPNEGSGFDFVLILMAIPKGD